MLMPFWLKMLRCRKNLPSFSPLLDTQQALEKLADGELLACPTEAVWGLSCDPFNEQAVASLLALKQRPVEKGLIVIFPSVTALAPFLEKPEQATNDMACAPGQQGITWLVEIKPNSLPAWVTGQHKTLAVRISSHPTLQALSQKFGPIVSTSANPTGAPEAKSLSEVKAYFADSLYYCQGELGKAEKPSIIKDLTTGQVLRG